DGAVAHEFDRAGRRLNLHLADRTAIREAAIRERMVALCRERTAQRVVEIVERLRRARDFEHADGSAGARPKMALRELDLLRFDLKHMRSNATAALQHALHGIAHAQTRHAHRAAGMRAAADRNDIGIALYQAYRLERHAKPLAHALREARLVALPAR